MCMLCANAVVQEGGKGAVHAEALIHHFRSGCRGRIESLRPQQPLRKRWHEHFCNAATATAMQEVNMVLLHVHAIFCASQLHSCTE